MRQNNALPDITIYVNMLTFQMLILIHKKPYHQRQYSKTWDSKCLALIAQVVRAFGMHPKVGGSSRNIFYLKNFDTFRRTSVRVSKMNAVARAQLTFQRLPLLEIYVEAELKQWTPPPPPVLYQMNRPTIVKN